MRIVLATRNPGKYREIHHMLRNLPIRLHMLTDFPKYREPVERGRTFQQIAIRKAVHAAKSLGMWAIGDDSGIEIAALGGRPGIRSARFAGKGAGSKELCEKVIRLVCAKPRPKRGAKFVCVLALASPEGYVRIFRGVCRGRITFEMRGTKGFGYDPIFIPCGYRQTFAELPAKTKNRISHRGIAARRLAAYIRRIGLLSG